MPHEPRKDKRFESDSPLHFFTNSEEIPMSDNKKTVDTFPFSWSVQERERGTAQIRFRVHGKAVSISTGKKSANGLSTKQQATLIRDWMRRHPATVKNEAGFGEEAERFIALLYEGRSKQTINEVRGHLARLRAVLGIHSVQQATKKHCEARKVRLQEGLSPKTWKNFLTTARKFFRWQVIEGNLPVDPLANFKNPSKTLFGGRTEVWEEERYRETLKELAAEERALLEVLYETGMDSGDLFTLRAADFVQARAPDGSKFWKLYKLRGKAKSPEEVMDQPLSTRAREILLPLLPDLWDFSRYCDGLSFVSSLLKKVKKAQVRAGYEPLDIKSLRHTFATRHASRYVEGQGGPPMEVLRQWMGHAKGSRTLERVYVHTKSSGMYMP